MTIQRIEPGPRMSQAVIHNGVVHLAGQIGEGSDVTAQSAAALANVERLLNAAGTNKSSILSATIWLSDMSDFSEMNAVWDAWIDPTNPPARACGEARLATSDYLVEFMIVAAIE